VTLAGYLFTAIIRPRFSGPIGALAIVGLCWWATSSYRLVRQIDEHAPSTVSFAEAVKASKDGEIYVRITGATPDCNKVLHWNLGTVVALVDSSGQVAAMEHVEECSKDRPASLEGVFLEPPFGLYGEAVAQGWDVTEGHLAFFEPDTSKSRAWTRIGIALVAVPLILGSILAGLYADQRKGQRRAWRMRALGLGMMAAISWFFYYAHEYVVLEVVPATAFGAVGFAVALAFVVVPESGYMQKVAERVLPSE
jgi:hypothetical protein